MVIVCYRCDSKSACVVSARSARLPHLRIKAGVGQGGGDVFGGDHGAVAHPGAAFGQVDVGLVDAGQVVQHEHQLAARAVDRRPAARRRGRRIRG